MAEMGREIDDGSVATSSPAPLESRPGVLVVGPPSVGKRTLLSRLLSVDFSDEPDIWTGVLRHGWTIDTKYYSVDVSVWTAQLDENFSLQMVPVVGQLDALVMVFDMNKASSFSALKSWVSAIDVQRFEILLCIGNKVDLLSGHFAHVEYRRRLQRQVESTCDPYRELLEHGISESEGNSLLGEDPSCDLRKSCLEWCSQHNIEFIEACASNADFDKCLSVDGDIQGIDRIFGALSAHMWPGMILKSGDKIMKPFLAEVEAEYSDEDSDYEVEYERLSAGSDEQWVGASWTSFDEQIPSTSTGEQPTESGLQRLDFEGNKHEDEDFVSTSASILSVHDMPTVVPEETGTGKAPAYEKTDSDLKGEVSKAPNAHADTFEHELQEREMLVSSIKEDRLDEDAQFAFEDLEQLVNEIGNMRENLRLMPDFQRREMAAKLAMKMATMFGEDCDEDS